MKEAMSNILIAAFVICGLVMGILSGFAVSPLQAETLKVLCIIMAVSFAYCFLVGEITRNNSQMDKLWSVLPPIYAWVVVAKGGASLRLIIMAILVTIWGARLTYNFAKKGAYSIRFWEGEEDYRWPILRESFVFKGHPIRWGLFDLFFIAFYQNFIVLLITLPMVAVMESSVAFGLKDCIATLLVAGAISYETIADKQQMVFQTAKWDMIKSGKKLAELPQPYSLGFNTTGLWNYSRHPNYLAEQSTWVFFYLFVWGAAAGSKGIFHWSILGSMLLVMLFMGSSMMAEIISAKKYPLYKDYIKKVNKYLPVKRYR